MYKLFIEDARRWIAPGKINPTASLTVLTLIALLYRHMPLRAMAWFRFGCWCKQNRLPFFPGFIQRQIYVRYGLEISVGADIGGGLYIAHPIGTVISVKRMGRNCSIIAAVTIGMRNEWEFPKIGDQVFIGAGARVLGGIAVGDQAIIGANAVVIHDVAPNTTVVGIPARAIQSNSKRVEV
jgi:serine O-acetyltransferase